MVVVRGFTVTASGPEEVEIGEAVDIVCSHDSRYSDSVKAVDWYKGIGRGNEEKIAVSKDGKYSTSSRTDDGVTRHTLHIDGVSTDDAKEYKCVVIYVKNGDYRDPNDGFKLKVLGK